MVVSLSELCVVPTDLVIVIDKSEHWAGQFERVRDGVSTLVTELYVGEEQTHIAVVSFADDATLHFNLLQYFQASSMQNAIRQIQEEDRGTATDRVSLYKHLQCSPAVWNSLPDELKNSDSFDSFKRFPKTILFSRY